MRRVAIVGGGIAGLSVAHGLLERGAQELGVEVVVLERGARPGGNIRTDLIDGYLCEWGPNGFLDNAPETLALVDRLSLRDRLHVSDDAARRRFLFRRGRLHELPGTPGGFLQTGVLSTAGKLRVAMEPFARRRPAGDETIHAFAARRIGREAADVLIDAMVSGVFGGNARDLSLRACFPKMWQMESDHGGLVRAFIARRRAGRIRRADGMGTPLGRLTSFRGGTEVLVQSLAARLGPALRLSCGVRDVVHDGRFRLALDTGKALDADAVVLTGGASATADHVGRLDGVLAAALRRIPSAPMVVVCLGYRVADMTASVDGFGFLVPRGEGPRLLGALWDSSVYPGRAPEGHALIRVMLGGAHDPDVVHLDDAAVLAVARDGLATVMGEEGAPSFSRVFRHPVGIPQYTVGHLERLDRIDARLAVWPGPAVLAGNAYRGVSINNCIAEAGPIADTLLRRLGQGRG